MVTVVSEGEHCSVNEAYTEDHSISGSFAMPGSLYVQTDPTLV